MSGALAWQSGWTEPASRYRSAQNALSRDGGRVATHDDTAHALKQAVAHVTVGGGCDAHTAVALPWPGVEIVAQEQPFDIEAKVLVVAARGGQ